MLFVFLISCFLFFITSAQAQLCQTGQPSAVNDNCYEFTCSGQTQRLSCDSESYYEDGSQSCIDVSEYPTTEDDYDTCRCSNTLILGLVANSRNSDNEYLYCTKNRSYRRYTCADIPSTEERPSDCGLCDSGNPTAVQGNCNSYTCDQSTQSCEEDQYFDDTTETCVPFNSYVNNNAEEYDGCFCSSSKRLGLIEGRVNAKNQHLYCTSSGAQRYSCSEIPVTESRPAECSEASSTTNPPPTTLCQNGLPAVRLTENCAQYRCGSDPEVHSCSRGTYFADSNTCESASISLSNECVCNVYNNKVLVKLSEDRLAQCNPQQSSENGVTLECPKDPLCRCVDGNDARVGLTSTEYAECHKTDERTWTFEKTACENGLFYDSELTQCKACHVEAYEYKAHPCDKNLYLFTTVQRCSLGAVWNDNVKSCVL